MKQIILEKPVNENYSAMIVKIKNLLPIENADKLQHANIYGNLVIVSKDVKQDDLMIYFPVETQLSENFLKSNNLYRDKILNNDKEKAGFFESNRRIRAVRLRGAVSQGFLVPITNFEYLCDELKYMKNNNSFIIRKGKEYYELNENDTFDKLFNETICKKHIIKVNNPVGQTRLDKRNKKIKRTEIVDNQFRFHIDTAQIYKNLHRLKPETILHISRKKHGTSLIVSNVLVKRKLSIIEKLLKLMKVNIKETEYKNVYASRTVLKNLDIDRNTNSFYDTDIWGKANNYIIDKMGKIPEGMTIYAEIVGYTDIDKFIQKYYDYGCNNGQFEVYVYRITFTNPEGYVYEFSAKQVQSFCKLYNIKPVEELYYGSVANLYNYLSDDKYKLEENQNIPDDFLDLVSKEYLEKDCPYCKSKPNTPDEGIVIRVEDSNMIESYKLKSFRFYQNETKQKDNNEADIEENS